MPIGITKRREQTVSNYSREAAFYDAEASRYSIDRRIDPAMAYVNAVASMADHCVSKARALVPNVSEGASLIAALYAADPSDVLAVCAAYGATIDELTAATYVDLYDGDREAFRTYDEQLTRLDPERFDPSWNRPRVHTDKGLTVKGRRDGYVIDGEGTRLYYAEALERADLWSILAGGEHLDLIGTDTFSWSQMVTHKPIREGSFVMRAEGAGSSTTGETRKKRTNVPRSVSYSHPRFANVVALPGWTSWRVLKEYRTSIRVRAIDENGDRVSRELPQRVAGLNHRGEPIMRDVPTVAVMASIRVIGHRVIVRPKPKRTAVKPRTKRVAPIDVENVEAITAAMVAPITAAIVAKEAARVAYRTADGIVVRINVDPKRANVAVDIRNADGAKVGRTTVRSAAAAVAAVRNRTR
jgi:hypothetical protein